jgi:hypothetical protein
MNRSIAYIGVGLILLGCALVASPIVLTGAEQFDIEQELGLFVAPFGLVVVLLGAVAHDPETTTVAGAFGSSEANVLRAAAEARNREAPRPPVRYNPKEPVACRYCRTNIPADLVQCPRCTRARTCRGCGRLLGMVLDRPTCPTCARAEAFCNCPMLARPVATQGTGARGVRRV